MAHERLRPDYLFDEEKIKQLKQIAPECFEDGKINFEVLKQNLGEWTLEDGEEETEHFGLIWPGKKDARRIASIPPEGTLEPVYGEGLKSDGSPDDDGDNDSNNIFIEGENLEVLKILQKSYANKIKMIYIDPPYNTGKDFVYNDNFEEPVKEYLKRTGQIDDEGNVLTTNKKSDGRFHSKWLSMMYPRLRLARNLLKEDGIIFISIGDDEVQNLKLIMNELFGEENFLSQMIWNTEGNTDNQLEIKVNHEYILTYCKDVGLKDKAVGRVIDPNTREDSNLWKGYADNNINKNNTANPPSIIKLPVGFPSTEKELFYEAKQLDEDFFDTTSKEKFISDEVKLKYDIENISGLPVKLDDMVIKNYKLVKPCRIYGGYANADKLKAFIDNDLKAIKESDGSTLKFYINKNAAVRYRKEREDPRNILSVLRGFGTTEKNRTKLKKIGVPFSYPKPVELLKYLISIGAQPSDSIILDFFAGSGTLGESVLSLNNKDDGEREYICVQFPEPTEEDSNEFKMGYKSISDITKARLKKTIISNNLNSGFKTFSLKESNFKDWTDFTRENISELESNLELFNEEPLKKDWTKSSLYFEILLAEGFPLNSKFKVIDSIETNEFLEVKNISTPYRLIICLDEHIKDKSIEKISLNNNEIFICLDRAISNHDKLMLSDQGSIKTI